MPATRRWLGIPTLGSPFDVLIRPAAVAPDNCQLNTGAASTATAERWLSFRARLPNTAADDNATTTTSGGTASPTHQHLHLPQAAQPPRSVRAAPHAEIAAGAHAAWRCRVRDANGNACAVRQNGPLRLTIISETDSQEYHGDVRPAANGEPSELILAFQLFQARARVHGRRRTPPPVDLPLISHRSPVDLASCASCAPCATCATCALPPHPHKWAPSQRCCRHAGAIDLQPLRSLRFPPQSGWYDVIVRAIPTNEVDTTLDASAPPEYAPGHARPVAAFRLHVLSHANTSVTPVEGTRLEGTTLLAGQWVSFLLTSCDAFGNPVPPATHQFGAPTPVVSCDGCLDDEPPIISAIEPGRWEVCMHVHGHVPRSLVRTHIAHLPPSSHARRLPPHPVSACRTLRPRWQAPSITHPSI